MNKQYLCPSCGHTPICPGCGKEVEPGTCGTCTWFEMDPPKGYIKPCNPRNDHNWGKCRNPSVLDGATDFWAHKSFGCIFHEPNTMNPYTVILLYPDYASENYGQETCMTGVDAEDVEDAITEARNECMQDNPSGTIRNPDDLFVIAVISGHHEDLK